MPPDFTRAFSRTPERALYWKKIFACSFSCDISGSQALNVLNWSKMEQKQENNAKPFTPVAEAAEEEFSEEDEQDSSSASSESGEWPNKAADENASNLLGTTSKVKLCWSKQMIPSATSAWACYLQHKRTMAFQNTRPINKLFRVRNFLLSYNW